MCAIGDLCVFIPNTADAKHNYNNNYEFAVCRKKPRGIQKCRTTVTAHLFKQVDCDKVWRVDGPHYGGGGAQSVPLVAELSAISYSVCSDADK
jgi:hypothetical protein